MRALTTPQFIKAAKSVHGSKYGYHKVDYVGALTKVTITCPKHGDFKQTPNGHLYENGCPRCYGNVRKTTPQFIKDAKAVHGTKYKYTKVEYVNTRTRVIITCPIHGNFEQIPDQHLYGYGCHKCTPFKYSKLAIKWIEGYAYSHRLKGVQHAENGGEYTIPGTNIRVDGYHARSNTVFEFHGDAFHGNPKRFSPRSKPNPYSNKTAQRLYKETKARERLIRKLGYKLVVMWELDFKG